jgi:hypothetical protein
VATLEPRGEGAEYIVVSRRVTIHLEGFDRLLSLTVQLLARFCDVGNRDLTDGMYFKLWATAHI